MSEYSAPDHGLKREPGLDDKPGAAAGDGGGRVRASDAEREAALRALAAHFADGRLDQSEFDERADAALAARTRGQLRTLFADLPASSASTPPVTPAAPQWAQPEGANDEAAKPLDAWQRYREVMMQAGPLVVLIPMLAVFAVVALLHGAVPFPVIPLAFILLRLRRRGHHRNREAHPWT